nr:uncharacterized protein LOC129266938 [Lytechinus pictus]
MTGNTSEEPTIFIPDVDPNDDVTAAGIINPHFVNVAVDVPPLDSASLPAYFPLPRGSAPIVSPWHVYQELKKTKVGKSAGPDGISGRIFREFALELSIPLTEILNRSFADGVVPVQWKQSVVVPIPKTSPPDLDKLRPIALTSHFAKVAELFVYRWLLKDIRPNMDPRQFGNRERTSTTHYLVDLLNFLHVKAEELGTVSTVVLTDFSKAFDLVDHTL